MDRACFTVSSMSTAAGGHGGSDLAQASAVISVRLREITQGKLRDQHFDLPPCHEELICIFRPQNAPAGGQGWRCLQPARGARSDAVQLRLEACNGRWVLGCLGAPAGGHELDLHTNHVCDPPGQAAPTLGMGEREGPHLQTWIHMF